MRHCLWITLLTSCCSPRCSTRQSYENVYLKVVYWWWFHSQKDSSASSCSAKDRKMELQLNCSSKQPNVCPQDELVQFGLSFSFVSVHNNIGSRNCEQIKSKANHSLEFVSKARLREQQEVGDGGHSWNCRWSDRTAIKTLCETLSTIRSSETSQRS